MKKELWLRLRHYHFEHLVPPHLTDHVMAAFGGPDAATRAFAGKLSRKLGWTPAFARRAIEEYRKFVYLGVVSDVAVTPSKIIDQVWHEHLLFSKAYRQFCGEVLGRDFDHHPELANAGDQTEQFRSQFEDTIARYESEFNTAPPSDIWGVTKFKPGLARVKRALAGTRRTTILDSDDDTPLYLWFDGSANGGGESYESMPEFGGGGGFSGAGGGDSWGDSHADATSGYSGSHGDSGHAGDSSSDSGSNSSTDGGSSDSGGSSCSSSCGGGGE